MNLIEKEEQSPIAFGIMYGTVKKGSKESMTKIIIYVFTDAI